MEILCYEAVVERKAPTLPRFVVVPSSALSAWKLEGTTIVEVTMNGHALGRRSLKYWGKSRAVWFFDLTSAHCNLANVTTGDRVTLEIQRASGELPPELTQVIESDPLAEKTWKSLSTSRRRLLSEHVRMGKQPKTRVRRAEAGLAGPR